MRPSGLRVVRAVLPPITYLILAITAVLAVQLFRPMPFSNTGDAHWYYLPLIKAHTDSLLDHGKIFRITWELGAGWTPAESAQVGFMYPLYLLANIGARLIGQPLAILEVSAALHLALAGWICHWLGPKAWTPAERHAWSLLAMLQPAAILLGMNFHNYLTCYPWYLGLLLAMLRRLDEGKNGPPDWPIWLCSAGFFWTAHPSMYVYGITFAGLWVLAETGAAQGFRHLTALGIAQILCIVPLLYIRGLAMGATEDWIGLRRQTRILLYMSEPFGRWLRCALLGNFMPPAEGMEIFSARIPASGVGMFFAPGLLLGAVAAVLRRRWFVLALVVFAGMLMGVRTFPWLHHLAVGPWGGFRWTWKLSVLFAPLGLVLLVRHGIAVLPIQIRPFIPKMVIGLAFISGLVAWRGLDFDLIVPQQKSSLARLGGKVAEARECMAKAGAPAGARIALVAVEGNRWPLPIWGLCGNLNLISGFPGLYEYEPLEPRWAAEEHLSVSTQWRRILDREGYLEDPAGWDRKFAMQGVAFLVTNSACLFSGEGVTTYRDRFGRTTWVKALPPLADASSPWVGSPAHGLLRTPWGDLLTRNSVMAPPRLNTKRVIRWERLPSGVWRGQISLFPCWVWVGEGMALMVGLGLAWGWRRSWSTPSTIQTEEHGPKG